jgi:hypothetical protein
MVIAESGMIRTMTPIDPQISAAEAIFRYPTLEKEVPDKCYDSVSSVVVDGCSVCELFRLQKPLL